MKLKKEVDLKELEKLGFMSDSSRYFIYGSLNSPQIKVFNIWIFNREIEFLGGDFPSAQKVLKKMMRLGFIENC